MNIKKSSLQGMELIKQMLR